MMTFERLVLLAGLFGVTACGAATSPSSGPSPQMPGLNPDEHMLLNPVSGPESLLGRAVTTSADGALVIADERAPGCKVTVKEEPATGTHESRQELGQTAVLSAGLPAIGTLKARYGNSVSAYVRIRNTKNLVADIQGPCGGTVVTRVKVGVGKREFQQRREGEAGGEAALGGVGVGGEARSWERVGETLTWDSEQAWAFRASQVDNAEDIDLEVVMPSELTDGDEYTIQISTQRQVWLVLMWVESDGGSGVLLPNAEHPTIVVPAGQRRALPTMRVGLRDPKQAARERIVIFAFTEREDYEDFRPPQGSLSEAEAGEYLTALPQRLERIPRRRWDRAEVRYLIQVKTP